MLSDSERQALREMQRRLSLDDPDFVRRFSFSRPGPRPRGRRGRRPGLIVLAEIVIALAIVGPNPLTEARIALLAEPPAPRRRTT